VARSGVYWAHGGNAVKVQAAVLLKPGGRLAVTELDLEEPRDDEVLVRVSACGVCHTDLWAREAGIAPVILGHETSGVVVETGARVGKGGSHLARGDRVILTYTWCGRCEACREKRIWECAEFSDNFSGWRPDGTSPFSRKGKPLPPFMRQGGFSTYTVCHQNAVVKVTGGEDLRLLGPLSCGIITGAGSVLNYLQPERGRNWSSAKPRSSAKPWSSPKPLAVGGTGTVGLSAILAAKHAGAGPIIAIDRAPLKLETAKLFGADYCVNGDEVADIGAEIKRLVGGLDYAFDTSGSRTVLEGLQKSLNPGARACGVGIGGEMRLSSAERRQGKSWESTTQGFSFPPAMIRKLLSWHRAGKFPFDRMIQFFDLEHVNEAFEAGAAGTVIKPVVVMPD
jgi:aryl-alcohol dehydrogenase